MRPGPNNSSADTRTVSRTPTTATSTNPTSLSQRHARLPAPPNANAPFQLSPQLCRHSRHRHLEPHDPGCSCSTSSRCSLASPAVAPPAHRHGADVQPTFARPRYHADRLPSPACACAPPAAPSAAPASERSTLSMKGPCYSFDLWKRDMRLFTAVAAASGLEAAGTGLNIGV